MEGIGTITIDVDNAPSAAALLDVVYNAPNTRLHFVMNGLCRDFGPEDRYTLLYAIEAAAKASGETARVTGPRRQAVAGGS